MKLKIKKIDRGVSLHDYAYFGDAGLDLYSNVDILIKASEREIISTGADMEIQMVMLV